MTCTEANTQVGLPAPAIYRPWSKGVYEVAPALKPFGTDFGNGVLDRQVFQIDDQIDRFVSNKREVSKRSRLHIGVHNLEPKVEAAAVRWIADRLKFEHPELDLSADPNLGDLMLLIPEDLCIVSTDGDRDWVSYVNVCAPSHWDPSERLGVSFFDGHQVVPGFERINKAAKGLVEAMVQKGPWVRFVWGLETDDRLNHHPIPPDGVDPVEWNGRLFNSRPYVIRFERQIIWGLPEVDAALFFIRVGFAPPSNEPELLQAVLSMSPEARRYKGIDTEFDGLVRQLTVI